MANKHPKISPAHVIALIGDQQSAHSGKASKAHAVPAPIQTEETKKYCFPVPLPIVKRLTQLKASLAQHGVYRKLNDTQLFLFAMQRLTETDVAEIANDYMAFVAKE